MRGLTPEERSLLSEIAAPHAPVPVPEHEQPIFLDLEEQGRVARDYPRWIITPAGREALRLWPVMQALEAQP